MGGGPRGIDCLGRIERLKGVLDRHLWFDLESISGEPRGRRDDGLSANLEEIGRIPVEENRTEPVRLVRRSDEAGTFWAFSPAGSQVSWGAFSAHPAANRPSAATAPIFSLPALSLLVTRSNVVPVSLRRILVPM